MGDITKKYEKSSVREVRILWGRWDEIKQFIYKCLAQSLAGTYERVDHLHLKLQRKSTPTYFLFLRFFTVEDSWLKSSDKLIKLFRIYMIQNILQAFFSPQNSDSANLLSCSISFDQGDKLLLKELTLAKPCYKKQLMGL